VFLKTKFSPIGIDVGSDSLTMLQLGLVGSDIRLAAAATYPMPPEAKTDPGLRLASVAEGVRQLMGTSGFKGRRAVTCLPGADVEVFHVRIVPVPDADLANALRWEVQRKVQFDCSTAVMRYVKVGEVYQNGDARWEVIVMIAPRSAVEQHLDMMRRLRVEVSGVQVAGFAAIECFKRLMRRREDSETSHFFLDIGAAYTHAVISHGTQPVFAKKIDIGGDAFSAAYAKAAGIPVVEAKLCRAQQVIHQPVPAGAASPGEPAGGEGIGTAVAPEVDRLIHELSMCVRYYGSVFQGGAINRLIFLGGEANQRAICQQIARTLGIAAQIGDPFCRVLRSNDGIDFSIDRRSPQPAWAVAMGCALVEVNNDS